MNHSVEAPDIDKLLRINETAELLRVSHKTVRRMIDSDQLRSYKVRGIRLIRQSDLMLLFPEDTRMAPSIAPQHRVRDTVRSPDSSSRDPDLYEVMCAAWL